MAEYMAAIGDDDDDEDEEEFQPGEDDDEDDEEEDFEDEDEEEVTLWSGKLAPTEKKQLSYKGKTSEGDVFDYSTSEAVELDLSNPSNPKMQSFVLKGQHSDYGKELHLNLTKRNSTAIGKKSHDEEVKDDNHVITYMVHGRGDGFELYGQVDSSDSQLECQYRPEATNAVTAAVAVAAKVPDDDEDVDVDENGVEYEELIALHQDAGLDVAELRKRYRSSAENDHGKDKKRVKSAPETSDDEDDDIGF